MKKLISLLVFLCALSMTQISVAQFFGGTVPMPTPPVTTSAYKFTHHICTPTAIGTKAFKYNVETGDAVASIFLKAKDCNNKTYAFKNGGGEVELTDTYLQLNYQVFLAAMTMNKRVILVLRTFFDSNTNPFFVLHEYEIVSVSIVE